MPTPLPTERLQFREKPAELKRSWKIAAIGTDKGDLEVATGEAGLTLIFRHTDLDADRF